MLRALEIPYVFINPGASFRGLHDSLVNYLGNERPQMLLTLHEEHAVAIEELLEFTQLKNVCVRLKE